jgi:hypothetical protein
MNTLLLCFVTGHGEYSGHYQLLRLFTAVAILRLCFVLCSAGKKDLPLSICIFHFSYLPPENGGQLGMLLKVVPGAYKKKGCGSHCANASLHLLRTTAPNSSRGGHGRDGPRFLSFR